MRCPSCTDLSVAQSNATTAIAVRHQIETMVAAGRSSSAIDQALVAEYGETILLVPPDAGGVPLIWIIPLVLGAGARGRRRRRLLAPEPRVRCPQGGGAGAVTVDESAALDRSDEAATDDRWYLSDERDFLQRSLADADREHAAGDLSDEDHDGPDGEGLGPAGRGRGRARCAGPRPTAHDGAGGADGAGPRARAAAVAAVAEVGDRGRVPADRAGCGHLGRALRPGAPAGAVLVGRREPVAGPADRAATRSRRSCRTTGATTTAALELYNEVLSEDPSNPAALAYAGYLQWNVGTSAHVAQLVQDRPRRDPDRRQ